MEMTQSKVEFARSLPASTPVNDVVAKAKAAGHMPSAGYMPVIDSKCGTTRAERHFIDLDLCFGRAQQLLGRAKTAGQRARQS
jgi:hypothetical protein